ncbi:uncharacterized protein LOC121267240 [Juglans microcarpa x Juglans regia]|uniref:uncharacterized protein LOC121267240 n=1 Tax=Juglans microcarpa x Juglans regia TaxID=2249226 RepID=UPI001B7DB6DF|nr:uncharacterized protein LOC121267240 [Juglans microcarpa x Juglans regia]
MEEIEEVWSRLRLNEEENTPIDVNGGEEESIRRRGERSLVGKICSPRRIGKEIVKATMEKIWRVGKPLDFEEIGFNCFAITLASARDKSRVLEGCPWLFDNFLFVLKDFDGETQTNLLDFDSTELWVQMHNLPLGYMNKWMGTHIGTSIGRVSEIDVNDDGMAWGHYLIVKIECNLRAPLARGRTVNISGGKIWVPFQYEKLPKLCFSCGCIVHGKDGCTARGDVEAAQYGTWMRARVVNKKQNERKRNNNQEKRSTVEVGEERVDGMKGEGLRKGEQSIILSEEVKGGITKAEKEEEILKRGESYVSGRIGPKRLEEREGLDPVLNSNSSRADQLPEVDQISNVKGRTMEGRRSWKRRARGKDQASLVCLLNLNTKYSLIDEDNDMVLSVGGKKARMNEGAEPVVDLYEVEAMM